MDGGAGDDIIYGNGGVDRLLGYEGDDTLWGGADGDYMDGGTGDDTLRGGEGNDSLNGSHGHDTLYGGYGDDTLYGGKGDDTLYSGEGDDMFHFHGKDYLLLKGIYHEGHDTIKDFEDGDQIKFWGVNNWSISTYDGGIRIEWDNGILDLEGLSLEDVTDESFIFG